MTKIQTYFTSRSSRYYRNFFWSWLALILIASSLPNINVPSIRMKGVEFRLDHLLHWFQYMTLAFLMVSWQYRKYPSRFTKVFSCTLVLGLLLAIGDEYHQLLIPGRSFTYADMISNALGVITGVLVAALFWRPLLKTGS